MHAAADRQTDRQTDIQTHRHRRGWPQYISRHLRLTRNVLNIKYVSYVWAWEWCATSCVTCWCNAAVQKHQNWYLLGEEASPSIGNNLWRVSTMLMRSAITPPKVNGFGWNFRNSEHIVWSWPWQILGAMRAEARAGDLAEVLFFFVR